MTESLHLESLLADQFEPNLVSIIIPVYKVQDYISECIDSILKQSYRHLEIILIDDAGGDDSIKIAEDLLTPSDLRWFVIKHEKNQGCSVARNDGIDKAHGEYIYLLDADDWIAENCIEKFIESAKTYDADIVYSNHIDIIGGVQYPSIRTSDTYLFSESPIDSMIEYKTTGMAGNIFIRNQFYVDSGVRFTPNIRGEDAPWSFSIIIRAKRISFVPDMLYYYRRWDGSFTCSKGTDKFKLECAFKVIKLISNESTAFDLWKRSDFRLWYVRNIFSFFSKVFNSVLTAREKRELLDKSFEQLYIPKKEFNNYTYHLSNVLKVLTFMLPKYSWLQAILQLKKLKQKIKRK